MAIDSTNIDVHASDWSPVRWAFHVWSWTALLVLFIALELWIDPLLASFVVCLKLGWRDVWTAIKLRRHSNPVLARVIGAYCLGQGCFKVAFGSVGLVAVVIAIEGLMGVAPRFERFILGLPLVILMLYMGMLFVAIAAGHSVVKGIPGWLDGTIYASLSRQGTKARCRGALNRVPWLLGIGLLLVSIVFLPAPVAALALLVMKGLPWGFPGGIAFTLIWILFAGAMYRALKQAAHSPEECWKLPADRANQGVALSG